jgi:hypothetical protein
MKSIVMLVTFFSLLVVPWARDVGARITARIIQSSIEHNLSPIKICGPFGCPK